LGVLHLDAHDWLISAGRRVDTIDLAPKAQRDQVQVSITESSEAHRTRQSVYVAM
jgi:hypothetical protein